MKSKKSFNIETISIVTLDVSKLIENGVYLEKPYKRNFFTPKITPGFYIKNGNNYERIWWKSSDSLMLIEGKVYTKYCVRWTITGFGRYDGEFRYFNTYKEALDLYHELVKNMVTYEEEF